jgi:hypothetical protein
LRQVSARPITLVALALLAGCGGPSDARPSPGPEEFKACLEDAGLSAQGGTTKPLPGDEDAPDVGELIVPPSGVFVAFYSTADRATRAARKIERNGELTRHGQITILYANRAELLPPLDPKDREKIENCV